MSTIPSPRATALFLIAAIATALVAGVPPAAAQTGPPAARAPLLIEGKRSLFQRVLTRPAAVLRAAPEASAPGDEVDPFSVYYVYGRISNEDGDWLEVGAAPDGTLSGWLAATGATSWDQQLTLAFRNPVGRLSDDGARLVPLMRDRDALLGLLMDEAIVAESRRMRAAARAALADGQPVPEEVPVVALEPEPFVDPRDQFYLLPVLEHERRIIRELRQRMLLMRVASIPLEEADPEAEQIALKEALADFRIGIVFVVDTSRSMGPFIDRTREALETIVDRLLASPDIAERVRFGMVGFRDAVDPAPGLGYVSRVYADLDPDAAPADLLARVAEAQEAGVSSQGFSEDALAGVDTALSLPGLQDFGAKVVVLVTDASTREGGDDLASVDLDTAGMNLLAQERDVAIMTLHLKAETGAFDHDRAEAQYRALSRFGDDVLYVPIEGANVDAFGRAVERVVDELLGIGRAALDGRIAEIEGDADGDGGSGGALARAGLAMQLAFLGQRSGGAAPDVIEGWIVDRDFERPTLATVEPRVLLTRNQLSDLKVAIEAILEAQRRGRLDPAGFFANLRTIAANLIRRPDRIGAGRVETLGDLLGEYLEGLPYQSEVMSLDEATWLSLGAARQTTLVNGLERKLDLYRRFNEDVDAWVRLAEGAPESEAVYAVPLDALP